MENNLFLDTVIENIPIGMFVKDPIELKYLRINKQALSFLRLPKEQVLGKTDFDIFIKEEADFVRRIDIEVINSGKQTEVEEQRIKRDNEELWFNTQKILVKDGNGDPAFLLGIAQNITQQKKQQDRIKQFTRELEQQVYERTKELEKSEKRFRALIDSGIDAIKMMDDQGMIFYASESHERIIGFTPQEMIHTSWLEYVHPEDIELAKKVLQQVYGEKSVPIAAAMRLRHKQGHYLQFEGSITNLLHTMKM
jgi:PAS domain S-box-containing protein